jgi:hypothetical protein
MESKDLTKVAPRSPYEKIGGFAILARAIDKCRAYIAGTNGEYHSDCPLDKVLFVFKGIEGADFKAYVEQGHTDEEIAQWVKDNGTPKTDEEINAWSDAFRTDFSYSTDPKKKDWFFGECAKLGLDPMTTTLFDFLEVDDKVSFGKGEVCEV